MENREVATICGYCGLVCSVCLHATGGCVGCRNGGGDADCHQRTCCKKKALDGCWQCDAFPCDRGYFASEAWRGVCVGFIRTIADRGIDAFTEIVASALGAVVDYGDYRFKTPQEVRALLEGDPGP